MMAKPKSFKIIIEGVVSQEMNYREDIDKILHRELVDRLYWQVCNPEWSALALQMVSSSVTTGESAIVFPPDPAPIGSDTGGMSGMGAMSGMEGEVADDRDSEVTQGA